MEYLIFFSDIEFDCKHLSLEFFFQVTGDNIESFTAPSSEDKLIIVAINDKGKVFINDQPTSFDALHDEIKKYLQENSKRIVYVKTHEDAAYQYMIKAFDIAKQVYQEMKLPPKVALGVIKRRTE